MSHYRVIIFEVDDPENSRMTELANVDIFEDSPKGHNQVEEPTNGYKVVDNLSKLASVFYGKGYKGRKV